MCVQLHRLHTDRSAVLGISRDSRHKRRHTGGKRKSIRSKRAFEAGRPPANTKLGGKRVRVVNCRGGNRKFRALRLETGNFSWSSEGKLRMMLWWLIDPMFISLCF